MSMALVNTVTFQWTLWCLKNYCWSIQLSAVQEKLEFSQLLSWADSSNYRMSKWTFCLKVKQSLFTSVFTCYAACPSAECIQLAPVHCWTGQSPEHWFVSPKQWSAELQPGNTPSTYPGVTASPSEGLRYSNSCKTQGWFYSIPTFQFWRPFWSFMCGSKSCTYCYHTPDFRVYSRHQSQTVLFSGSATVFS